MDTQAEQPTTAEDQPTTDADAPIRAEVASELEPTAPKEYPPGTVTVEVGGETVHILPLEEWSATAQEDLAGGKFMSWAEDALAGDDYYDVWCEMRDGRGPTIGQINDMFEDWGKITGMSAGKSRAAKRSFGRTRRR